MTNAGLDTLIWVLIYGGLLLLSLGVFVRRSDAGLGTGVMLLGGLLVVVGVVLVFVRSRRPP